MNKTQAIRFVVKPLVFLACLVPTAIIAARTFGLWGDLGANPIEEVLDHFGNWGLRFILITLAITPFRKLTGWNTLVRFRRMIGLFAFYYAFMHFTTWLVLDRNLHVPDILEDVVERPFIAIGFVAVVLLSALAITSFAALRRRMGRNWQKLHNAVYLIAVLAIWHYWWQVKNDITEPLIYAGILAVLLGARVYGRRGKQRQRVFSA